LLPPLPAMMRVFGRPTSSNTQKVLWTLHELRSRPSFDLILASARMGAGSNLLCENSGGKPYGVVDTDEYARMNPMRTVPCLVDGDLAVWESHSIVRYLAQKYSPDLHLSSVEGLAKCSPWMDWLLFTNFHECNHHLIDQTARTLPEQRDEAKMRDSYKGYVERFQKVEKRINETKAFLAGNEFTIADIVVGAEVCRFSCGMLRWAQDGIPRGLERAELPYLESYFRKLQERPAFRDMCLRHEREHQQMEPLHPDCHQPLLPDF